MKLSVAIITLNEDKIIEKTLKAVKEIADEIIVVDSGSTDSTVEICKRYNATVYNESWKGFGPQKNSAIEKCTGEWVLLLDADEVVSPELKEKIVDIINGKNKYEVYDINRCSICFGKEIEYGGWSNQYATRLWKNKKVKLNDNLVHEDFITDCEKGKIKEKIAHYSYLNLSDYLKRFDKYTTLGALEYYKRGKKASVFQIIFNPFYKFIRMYFIRGGFLDGLEGFLLAIFSSCYSMAKYFKLREIWKNSSYLD